MSCIVQPVLFHGALLVGVLPAGPTVGGDTQLVLSLSLFLTAIPGFFMIPVHSARPWTLVCPNGMRVGGMGFLTRVPRAVIVSMDRRMMFERAPHQLMFVVEDPESGPIGVTSGAIRNVQDVGTIRTGTFVSHHHTWGSWTVRQRAAAPWPMRC